MNRYLKFGLLGIGGLAVLVAALLAVVVALFDPNDHKSALVDLVKEKKQRVLRIDGSMRLSFWPDIGAELPKLWLSEARNADRQFASVESMRVSVKLLPLLSKRVVVDEIRVQGLQANLVRRKDGTTNFDDLLAKDDRKDGGKVEFDVARVDVLQAALRYADEATGAGYSFEKLDLRTGRIAPGVPGDIDLAARLRATRPALDIGVALRTRLLFDADAKRVGLDAVDMSVKGRAAGVEDLVLALKGRFDANAASGSYLAEGLSASLTGRSGKDSFEMKLAAPKVTVAGDKVSGEKISLDAKVQQPGGHWRALLAMPGVEGTPKAFRAGSLTIDIDGKAGDSTVKGRLSAPVDGSLETGRYGLAKVAADVDVRNPGFPNGGARVSLAGAVHVDVPKHTARADLNARFDDTTVTGTVSLARFSPASVAFDLSVDRLDADRYSPPKKPADRQTEQPFDLSALKGLDASGSFKAGSLKVANIRLANVRVDMKAVRGRVELNPLQASLYQGTAAGSVLVDATRPVPAFAVRQNLAGVNVSTLLQDVADKDILEGRGTVAFDVNAQGNLVSAIKRSLSGSASLNLADGAVKGVNIGQMIRDARAKVGAVRGQQTQAANAGDKTDFTELKATFAIRNGIAHNNDLSMKSPLLRLTGEGDINVGEDSMNYLARTTIVATAAGQGRDLGDLKGLTVPVRVSGPFTKLSYHVDFGAMASGLVGARVEEKKEEIKAKVQDRVQDRLKGLFGR